MYGIVVALSSMALLSPTLTGVAPPVDRCDGSLATVFHFTPRWCGKSSPESFARFEEAWAEYKKSSVTALKSELSIYDDLFRSCGDWGAGFQPADPWNVVQITSRLDAETTPAIDAMNEARNEMLATVNEAFSGNPDRNGVKMALEMTKTSIEILGRTKMMISTSGDAFSSAQTEETCGQAHDQLQTSVMTQEFSEEFGENQYRIMQIVDDSVKKAKALCGTLIKVSAPMSEKKIKKSADSKTARFKKSGGASLMYPSTLDVGRRKVQLPLTLRSTTPGNATISVTRAGKGIVATAGDVSAGSFGLLMTIPSGTKPGKAKVTYTIGSGASTVVVKGVVQLI